MVVAIGSVGGGIAGFIAGVLAEPIKLLTHDWYEVYKTKRELYSELAECYHHLRLFIEDCETRNGIDFGRELDVAYYEKVIQDNPLIRKRIRSWFGIEQAYGAIAYYSTEHHDYDRLWKAKAACKKVEEIHELRLLPPYSPIARRVPSKYRHLFK